MKLNIYKNQNEVAYTFETDAYDLMYGTVEDVLDILDEVTGENATNDDLIKAISSNRDKLNDLLLDIFPDATAEDLRNVKVKELIPLFIELFGFVKDSFGESKTKN